MHYPDFQTYLLIREIGGNIRLAPFYDLISTRVYSEIAEKMVMKIGKEA
jgi:serine/threonine protein kinase HipA of HipAB toxin-antitoxin module